MKTNHQMNYYDYSKTLSAEGVVPVLTEVKKQISPINLETRAGNEFEYGSTFQLTDDELLYLDTYDRLPIITNVFDGESVIQCSGWAGLNNTEYSAINRGNSIYKNFLITYVRQRQYGVEQKKSVSFTVNLQTKTCALKWSTPIDASQEISF